HRHPGHGLRSRSLFERLGQHFVPALLRGPHGFELRSWPLTTRPRRAPANTPTPAEQPEGKKWSRKCFARLAWFRTQVEPASVASLAFEVSTCARLSRTSPPSTMALTMAAVFTIFQNKRPIRKPPA